MVKRSPYARLPPVPKDWIPKSCPTPRAFPFERLVPSELLFFQRIIQRSLFSKSDLLELLHECFGEFLSSLSNDSLGGNLFVGECYADKEYFARAGVSRGFIRVFRLGLVVAVPMPLDNSRFSHWFCYPFMSPPFILRPDNFSRPFPPHNPFAEWCFARFRAGLTESEVSAGSNRLRKIPLLHTDKDYIADHCLHVQTSAGRETFWFEIHTGSEGYDEQVFIPRLLSAETFLKDKGKYVVIVPFKRNRDTALRAISKYNRLAEVDDTKPSLELELSEIITYHGIHSFREKLGFYNHLSRV